MGKQSTIPIFGCKVPQAFKRNQIKSLPLLKFFENKTHEN